MQLVAGWLQLVAVELLKSCNYWGNQNNFGSATIGCQGTNYQGNTNSEIKAMIGSLWAQMDPYGPLGSRGQFWALKAALWALWGPIQARYFSFRPGLFKKCWDVLKD